MFFGSFSTSGRNLGALSAEESACQYRIGEGEQRKQLCGVLGQTTVTGLAMTEQAFGDMEATLDFGAALAWLFQKIK